MFMDILIDSVLLIFGIYHGFIQTLYRAGLIRATHFAGIEYYQGLTAHGGIVDAPGALVLADSYQAIGSVELDVRTLGADFVTGGTVKYLLGTAGLGFMWVRGTLLGLTPTEPAAIFRAVGCEQAICAILHTGFKPNS